VKGRLEQVGHQVELRIITTTGDRVQDRPLDSVGGKGAFLKEIEEALLAEEVDLAVHSLKDVPIGLPEGLTLCAFLQRADPRDALLSASGKPLAQLASGSRIGTSSLRRRSQLLALRPDLPVVDLRGNLDTRIRRLREGAFDAIILAMAGLTRLGRAAEVTEVLDPGVMLPAPGQGAIALECRQDDLALATAVRPLHHEATARAVRAERALLAGLGGGCNVPLGAFATEQDGGLLLSAFVARLDGSELLRDERRGHDPDSLGQGLAEALLARGAAALMGR
jgi:hydroxymethylbilane synthase